MSEATAAPSALDGLRREPRSPLSDAARRLVRTPVGAVSLAAILLLMIAAALSPVATPHDPFLIADRPFLRPSFTHWMGTDSIGRDLFSRVLIGARISLYVGVVAVVAGTLSGSFVGLISGFAGGKLDLVVQRVVDSMVSIPALVLALVIVSVFGPGTTNGLLAIALVIAPNNSRVIRGAVLSVKENVYIEAASATGASPWRVMLRHVLPNVTAPILILVSASLGAAILIEAALSFFSLGTQPPDPSWGYMLSKDGRAFMERAPWLAIFPGLAISITVLAFNLLGDVIRDVLDPRLRGTR